MTVKYYLRVIQQKKLLICFLHMVLILENIVWILLLIKQQTMFCALYLLEYHVIFFMHQDAETRVRKHPSDQPLGQGRVQMVAIFSSMQIYDTRPY